MLEKLAAIEAEAVGFIDRAQTETELQEIKAKYLGRKGVLTGILREISQLSPEERPVLGKKSNELKEKLSRLLELKEARIKSEELKKTLAREKIDPTLPGRRLPRGHRHPLTLVFEEICDIFKSFGFSTVAGPEIEYDYFNFEALNIPPDHPARDMQDTFYVTPEILLRTHTSPVQIRVMQKERPPIRILSPGKVYRRDSDVTHSPMFHQVEGLLVDKNVAFSDLKGILTAFVKCMFGEKTRLRFRPSYFPFTEPSAEVDISCVICSGSGCRVCGESGWLEILGSGMVDPQVFINVGYDPEEISGFAFGLGVERIAMLKYGIGNIRHFTENDLRFLHQF